MQHGNGVFAEDIAQILSDEAIPWRDMQGAAVLVTGATGLIGAAIVRVLLAANEKHGLGLQIIGSGRDAEKSRRLLQAYGLDAFVQHDIRNPFPDGALPPKLDYIFHCAAMTGSADMVAKPVDVIMTAVDGTRHVLELAKGRHCRSMVYLSSMEVYGQTDLPEVRETDLGFLDLANPRASYPESKRLCESLCVAYAKQYGTPVAIARLAQTFGASTPTDDKRVFAQFARKAMAGEDIELHTQGNSRGNYCCTADAVRGLLTILLKGSYGEAYNVANPDASTSIREMAHVVASDVCGGRISVTVRVPDNIAERGYAPDVGYRLNADKLKNLGWRPMYGLADMYTRMMADWREAEAEAEG